MRGSEIGLQAVLLHSPLAFVVLDYNRASGKRRKPNVATGRLRTGMTEARMFLQLLTDFDSLFRQVNLIGQANQHSTFVREEGTCGFLALVVSEGVVVGEAEDFDYDDRSAHGRVTNLGDQRHRAGKFFLERPRTYMCGRAIF